MVHLGHPSGRGFLIVDVWRSQDLFRVWWAEVMEPAIAPVGLRPVLLPDVLVDLHRHTISEQAVGAVLPQGELS